MGEAIKSVFKRPIHPRAAFLSLIILIFTAGLSYGDVIDQEWKRPSTGDETRISFSIANNAPIGQEFTPEMDNITGVDLSLKDFRDPLGTDDTTIEVRIREETIDGVIIASGITTFTTVVRTWMHFDLDGPVPLIPGNLYVIEAVMLVGSEFWTWHSWADTDGLGLPGRLIASGVFAEPDNAFGFRTYAVPEPGTILLLGFGALLLRKKAVIV